MANIEIERKFLVIGEYKHFAFDNQHIAQGYLSSNPERTVRIRIKGEQGFITVKGIGDSTGLSHFEWEKEIDVKDAQEMLALCGSEIIDKTRYYIRHDKHIIEVDEFHGANEGLTMAEVELSNANEHFEKPDWLGEEVTSNVRYFNTELMKNPYSKWNSNDEEAIRKILYIDILLSDKNRNQQK